MKQKILEWIMSSKPYRIFVGEWLPHIRFSTAHCNIRGFAYLEGHEVLQPGHIVLSVDGKKLSSWFIPGVFSHVAFCVAKGDSRRVEVAEMTHKHFTESCFYDLCKEADRVVILECIDFDESYVPKMISKCLSYKGTPYDFEFDPKDDDLYCSELVYQSDFERRLDVSLEELAGLGYKYLSPDGLYKAKNIRVVWDSDISMTVAT